MCTTRVCVSRLSTNQPDWNKPCCATLLASNTYHSTANVVMSKIELTGPMRTMNRPMSLASQRCGVCRYSSSMRSNGIDSCEMSIPFDRMNEEYLQTPQRWD